MSSRVFVPGDPKASTPVVWRKVQGKTTDGNGPPDPNERLDRLQRECEDRIAAARAAGVQEGKAAGRSQAAAEQQPVLDRLARSIGELAQMRTQLRRDAEEDVVKLALAIARRLVRRELAIDPDALRGLIVAALEKLRGQEICRVRVHPAHAALVTDCLRSAASGALVEVIQDSARELGSIIFETQRGNLDASVDSQLHEIERGLADRLRSRP
jgi:flagellar assembly protein FliH